MLLEDIDEAFPSGFRTDEESAMLDASIKKAHDALAKAKPKDQAD